MQTVLLILKNKVALPFRNRDNVNLYLQYNRNDSSITKCLQYIRILYANRPSTDLCLSSTDALHLHFSTRACVAPQSQKR